MDQAVMNLEVIKLTPSQPLPIEMLGVKKFDFENPLFDPIELSNALQLMTFETQSMGLAANQLGYCTNVFFLRGLESACFNPKIVDTGEDEEVLEETTASIPGLIIKIKRKQTIRVRFTDALNNTNTHIFSGLTARVFQRKMDYLNGIRLVDRANQYHKDQAIKNWNNERKANGLI